MEFGSFKAPSWRGISYGQTSDDQTTEDRIEIWGLKERDNQTVRLEEGIWGRSFEIWKYEDKQNIPLQRNLGSPIARHAQWVRCLHGLRPLLYEVRRRAPYMSLPSFLPCRDFLESWVSLCFLVLAIFYLSGKGGGEKGGTFFEFRHSIPAFPMAILEIYGMLFVKTAGLFMFLYYINNGRLRFLKSDENNFL